jgi:hypothetical protein
VPRLILLNTGSVRFDLPKGPFTFDDSFIVSPFTDAFEYIPDVPYSAAKVCLLSCFLSMPRFDSLNCVELIR